ncbi:hypothetical protein [Arenibaculum pallidiluteum]|uniref:hypothetical protein n=1 Tax=Arenibaculum pallidiluteum TaxID=2812559 RepID=UPI001B3B9A87|nr:hypothetical protein [Arenibaculum pallidiluteum]
MRCLNAWTLGAAMRGFRQSGVEAACRPVAGGRPLRGGPFPTFLLAMAALVIVSLYTSISGLIKAELFPPEVRALGVGRAYAIANALFGGTAEYVALWLNSMGQEEAFFWYVTAMCAIAFVVSLRMPDPRRHGYLRD